MLLKSAFIHSQTILWRKKNKNKTQSFKFKRLKNTKLETDASNASELQAKTFIYYMMSPTLVVLHTAIFHSYSSPP